MKILTHRGMWDDQIEQNSLASFSRSISKGFGIEMDLRDSKSKIVISHDIPEKETLTLEEALDIFAETKETIAINIKSDGILDEVSNTFKQFECDWFLFDMSIPETYQCFKKTIPYLVRFSEYETKNDLFDSSAGIWLDSFIKNWFDETFFENYLNKKRIYVVSSELHGRDKSDLWQMLKKYHNSDNLYLCTDFPLEADKFFNS